MHMEHVARLCERLFDAFAALHRLGPLDRDLLACAARLHDVGLAGAPTSSGHHKRSQRTIEAMALPALTREERRIVASLARYHRKAAPKPKHKRFRALSGEGRERVVRLAPILRIADGLDRGHENAVLDIRARFARPPVRCRLDLYGRGDLAYAAWGAERKAGLFRETYGVALTFEPRGPVADD
jgi:exopolyphosphatase/guanosine-5'-triphosphate,3'-diphosphate pyrophosphatase